MTDFIEDVIAEIRRRAPKVNMRDFDNDKNMIHYANGWLNIKTKEFSPHTPERLSLVKLTQVYEPTTTLEEIEKAKEEYHKAVLSKIRKHYERVVDSLATNYRGIPIEFKDGFYKCSRCKFKNIHLESIQHHIDNTTDARHTPGQDKEAGNY